MSGNAASDLLKQSLAVLKEELVQSSFTYRIFQQLSLTVSNFCHKLTVEPNLSFGYTFSILVSTYAFWLYLFAV